MAEISEQTWLGIGPTGVPLRMHMQFKLQCHLFSSKVLSFRGLFINSLQIFQNVSLLQRSLRPSEISSLCTLPLTI